MMDHHILHLYDDWDIDREYTHLQVKLLIEKHPIKRALLRIKLLNIALEIKKRSVGQTHFAGREFATAPDLDTVDTSK